MRGPRYGFLGLVLLALLSLGWPARADEIQPPPLELNQASRAELESLPGLGIALTTRLLDARERRPFCDWQDLLRRHLGIGQALARKLSAHGLRIQGQSWTPDTVLGPPKAEAASSSL